MSQVAGGHFRRKRAAPLILRGKQVTIQGPSPDLSPARPFTPSTGCQDLQIHRSMEHVRSVRQNPYPLVSVLPGVRNRRPGPVPSGQSVRKL
jgi:hypothetical protein